MARMVIVGAGECGARAALTLREQGYEGSVVLIGEEAHPPYERPPLSKEAMIDEAEPIAKAVAGDRLAEAGVELVTGTQVSSLDPVSKTVATSNGRRFGYDKLLLATGAAPRRLKLANNSQRSVYLRTFNDALTIRACLKARVRVAIIGGGFIGLELAAAARNLGCGVSVIEAQARILMRGVPAEIAAMIQAEHDRQGVRTLCGRGISAIDDVDDRALVQLADGEAVEADLVIIAIGVQPNTVLAEAAGLAIENGVAVDDRLRTSDPSIFAAGDCCSFPVPLYGGRRVQLEAWRCAQEQGALAAMNMLGANRGYTSVPWFWSDQYHLGMQIAGLPDEGTEVVRRELGKNACMLFHLAGDGRLVAASAIGPGAMVGRDIRLAEMLIERRAYPPREKLAIADAKLKALLAA